METEKDTAVEEEQIETEIPAEEIIGAIDEGLEAAPHSELAPEGEPAASAEGDGEPEPEPEGEPEPEPEAKADEPEAKATEEPKPEEPKSEAEAKPSDDFGTLDKDTPEKTRERFQKLKDGYDEVVAERDQHLAENNQWREAITGTGTNPEQFGMALQYLSLVNSGKVEDMESAYEIMSKELETIAQAIGRPVPGVHDPLSSFSDLKERVLSGDIDEKDALEIAQARQKLKLNDAAREQEQFRTQQEQQSVRAIEQIKVIGEQLRANDPYFEQKVPYMKSIITTVTGHAPPEKWASMVKEAYDKLPAMPVAKPEPEPSVPNPIRPGGVTGSTGMEKNPGSAFEAVSQAIERGF